MQDFLTFLLRLFLALVLLGAVVGLLVGWFLIAISAAGG